tara:strand:- start:825 stop:1034 length:210 start_codon:yes stop_codon:yes gene_type:complete
MSIKEDPEDMPLIVPMYSKKSTPEKNKPGYCYVGDQDGMRHCVKMDTNDLCMSGDTNVSKERCIYPNLR